MTLYFIGADPLHPDRHGHSVIYLRAPDPNAIYRQPYWGFDYAEATVFTKRNAVEWLLRLKAKEEKRTNLRMIPLHEDDGTPCLCS